MTDEREEEEANAFAVELLTGNAETAFRPVSKWLKADALAASASDLGRRTCIDPGVIALNYSWNQGFFPVAMAALKILQPEANAQQQVRDHYVELDLERLAEDTQRFFNAVTSPI